MLQRYPNHGSIVPGGRGDRITLGNCITMTKKVDDGFTGRVLMALVTELVDRNYEDAKVLVQTLANEHGVGTYAERVFAQEVR
jgi:hypothetical protein